MNHLLNAQEFHIALDVICVSSVKATVDLIKARLEEDAAARAEGRKGEVGLSAAFQRASILASERDEQRVEIARETAIQSLAQN